MRRAAHTRRWERGPLLLLPLPPPRPPDHTLSHPPPHAPPLPATPARALPGSAHVQTRPAARDKKKHDPGCLVKGRNEPCNIVQVFEVVAGEVGSRGGSGGGWGAGRFKGRRSPPPHAALPPPPSCRRATRGARRGGAAAAGGADLRQHPAPLLPGRGGSSSSSSSSSRGWGVSWVVSEDRRAARPPRHRPPPPPPAVSAHRLRCRASLQALLRTQPSQHSRWARGLVAGAEMEPHHDLNAQPAQRSSSGVQRASGVDDGTGSYGAPPPAFQARRAARAAAG